MVKEPKYGLMERSTKESGKIIRQMVMENSGMLTETFMRANGKMIKPMVMVFIYT